MTPKHVLGDVCDIVKRSEIFHIDPVHINVVDGWNARTDFSGEDELVAYIKENGVPEPLRVRKNIAEKKLELVSGERRLRAVRRAIAEGCDIKSVPVIVIPKGASDADLLVSDLGSNSGKCLTSTEEAGAFKRLINWGFTIQEISVKTGKSVSHIRNRLELSEASPEVKAAVEAGDIPIGKAQEITRASEGSIDKQKEALEEAKAKPKKTRQVIRFVDNQTVMTGFKEVYCDPILDLFDNPQFIKEIKLAGFNPETIKITIEPGEYD